MHTSDNLPIALISTNNIISATRIISELIEEELNSDINDLNRVWRLENKYYRADIRIRPLVDGEPPPMHLSNIIEAHIIYLDADENEEIAEQRLVQVGSISKESQVRLVLYEGNEYPSLASWASRQHYELVALQPISDKGDDDDEDEEDAWGISRVRAALHAHVWKGLVRLDKPNEPLPVEEELGSDSDSCDSWGSWQGAEDAGGAEAAAGEAFAQLVGSLGARRGALSARDDAARRDGAARLVAAVHAALAPPHR